MTLSFTVGTALLSTKENSNTDVILFTWAPHKPSGPHLIYKQGNYGEKKEGKKEGYGGVGKTELARRGSWQNSPVLK